MTDEAKQQQAFETAYDADWHDPAMATERAHFIRGWNASVELDRQQRGEVVVSRLNGPNGPIVAVTRQDQEGRILSVIAEATPQPAEPVVKQSLTAEREAFDNWLYLDQTTYDPDDLNKSTIDLAREAWQARAALAQPTTEQSLQDEPAPLSRTEDWIEPVKGEPSDDDLAAMWADQNPDYGLTPHTLARIFRLVRTALARYQGAQPAASAEPVAYLDIGTGYMDLGSDLDDEQLTQLPKGRHMLIIAGTHGIDGYTAAPVAAQPTSSAELTLICPTCGADRFKETCKGNPLNCGIKGETHGC